MLSLEMRRQCLVVIAAGTLNLTFIASVFGATSQWVNVLGGDFEDANNWSLGAPGSLDSAVFNSSGEYVVNFSNSATNRDAVVETGTVTFDISVDEKYALTNNSFSFPGLKIGTNNGFTAELIVSIGTLQSYIKLGTRSGTRGEMTLTSAGTSEGELFVGERGHGVFNITPGTSHAGDTAVGLLAGSVGEVNITGPDASLSGGTTIGFGGTGTVNILDGGKMLGIRGRAVGISASGVGILNVRGVGSVVDFRNIAIGQSGLGELRVTDGGTLAGSSLGLSEFVEFGSSVGGSGSGLISGVNSSLSTGGQLAVGVKSYGSLVVENGASITSETSYIGLTSTGNGSVVIDDAVWTISDKFYIGGSTFDTGAFGKLDVVNGGSVSLGGDAIVWANGILNLVGAELTTNRIDVYGVVSVDDGSALHSSSEVITHHGAELFLTGTITGDLVNAGTLVTTPENVLNSPHTANIDGDFSQPETGVLKIAIFGPGQTNVAKLVVEGDINSEGEILLVFQNDFIPEIGMLFDIYDSDSANLNESKLIRTSEPDLGARFKDTSSGLVEIVTVPISIPVMPKLFLIIFVSLTLLILLSVVRVKRYQ